MAPACLGNLLLCDDFEQAAIDDARWSGIDADAVSIDPLRAFSGRQSLHIRAQNEHDGGGWLTATLPEELHQVLFGRARLYLSGPAPHHHTDFIKAEGESSIGHAYYRFGFENQNLTANYFAFAGSWVEGAIPTDRFDPGPKPYAAPIDRWVCVEWRFDGPGQRTDLWLDGIAIEALTKGRADDQSWPAPVFEQLSVGLQLYQAESGGEGVDLWLDDVAFDEERIGCE